MLVSPPVFKTEREARDVSGGFDSHPFPPAKRPNRRFDCGSAVFYTYVRLESLILIKNAYFCLIHA